jgi:2,3-bisphosphoglycerate-dependent phosphoglycerate mutase
MKGGEQHRKHGEREHPYGNRCPRVAPHQTSSGQRNRSAIANPSPEVPEVTSVALPSRLPTGRSLCQSTGRDEGLLLPRPERSGRLLLTRHHEKGPPERTSRYAHGVTASVVLLIRHGAPEPPVPGNSGKKDDERPLTSEGLLAAERLAERMRVEPITAVFSSPSRRALETVQPIASSHTLPVRTIDDLRERRLSAASLAEPAFLEALRRSREDPAFALPGGETANEVRLRGLRVLDKIRRDTLSGVAVAGTHGGLISILRWHLGEEFTIDEALAEPMLAIYPFRWDRDGWRIDPR